MIKRRELGFDEGMLEVMEIMNRDAAVSVKSWINGWVEDEDGRAMMGVPQVLIWHRGLRPMERDLWVGMRRRNCRGLAK